MRRIWPVAPDFEDGAMGPQAKKMYGPLEAGEDKEMYSLLELLEGNAALQTPWFLTLIRHISDFSCVEL